MIYEERQALLITMGQDGFYLMETLLQADEKRALWKLPGVDILRQVWLQQYRLYNWVTEVPIALTRISHFASLAPIPALVSGSWRVA